MGRFRAAIRRVRGDQAGISLIEVMVSMTLMTIVMGAILALLDSSARSAPREKERSDAIREVQVGLHRMTRELRQATNILGTNPRWILFQARLQNTDPATSASQPYRDRQILLSCGDHNPGRCARYEAAPGDQLPTTGETLISRVSNWNATETGRRVFDYPPAEPGGPAPISPASINIRIEVPSAGERAGGGYRYPLTFEDGVTVRNLVGR